MSLVAVLTSDILIYTLLGVLSVYLIIQGFGRQTIKYLIVCGIFIVLRLLSGGQGITILMPEMFLFMVLQPVIGALSDKVGRRPILIAFGVLGTLCTVPILTTLHTIQTWWGAFFLIMAALIIVSGYTSINAVVKAELFPTEIRALGVGLPYALTVSIFGGTADTSLCGSRVQVWKPVTTGT